MVSASASIDHFLKISIKKQPILQMQHISASNFELTKICTLKICFLSNSFFAYHTIAFDIHNNWISTSLYIIHTDAGELVDMQQEKQTQTSAIVLILYNLLSLMAIQVMPQ